MSGVDVLDKLRQDAIAIFQAAIEAVDAEVAVRRHVHVDLRAGLLRLSSGTCLSLSRFKRVLVVGGGKAAASMAFALEQVIAPAFEPQGTVNVKHVHTSPRPRFICLNEAGHPLPDAAGVEGVRRIEDLLQTVCDTDLLFVLISGGASALLPAPAPGLSLEEKQETTDLLLRAGADIYELNAVRKHLSRMKGGQLALRAQPATVVSLILSDVIGDRLDVIGSGLTAPDPSTFEDAENALRKYDLLDRVPASVLTRLRDGRTGQIPETPKDFDSFSSRIHNLIVGSNRLAIEAAADAARSLGYHTSILSSTFQGETRGAARFHVEILREILSSGNPIQQPACLLSGGETTVTVHGKGKGGRNQEFGLAAAIALEGMENAVVLAAGTDGTDGPTDAAGAIVDGTTAFRATAAGLSMSDHLDRNDSYPLLHAVGDLLKTGPTGTNVMDLNIMIAGKKAMQKPRTS